MNKLTEKALAAIIVVYEIGDGVPAYMFGEHDIIDAIAGGFLKQDNDSLYLTKNGLVVLAELAEYKEVRSFETELSTETKKVIQ